MSTAGSNNVRLFTGADLNEPAHGRSLVLDLGLETHDPMAVLIEEQQRQLVTSESGRLIDVFVPRSFAAPVVIELVPFGGMQVWGTQENYTKRVRILIVREMGAAYRGRVRIFSNGGTGDIDYTQPLDTEPMNLWNAWQDKSGWGMSDFGRSDFGFDSASTPGFGRGRFGFGEHGYDAFAFDWISRELTAGTYKFGIEITNSHGQTSRIETTEITIE